MQSENHKMAHVDRKLVADRMVTLAGGQNFREVGGYPTTDGKQLRRGRLWRSAKLDELTKADADIIAELGIRTIADLRRTNERSSSPTPEALLTQTRVLAWDVQVAQQEEIMAGLFETDRSNDEYVATMLELYRQIPEQHVTHLSDLYTAIADGETPVLIHCAAGKDRTGIAVGFLLDAIGIERVYTLSDYAETEHLLDWDRLAHSAVAGAGVAKRWLDRLAPDAMPLLQRSDPRYLASAFGEMETRYGSTVGFMRERLGLSDAVIARLRDQLLES